MNPDLGVDGPDLLDNLDDMTEAAREEARELTLAAPVGELFPPVTVHWQMRVG